MRRDRGLNRGGKGRRKGKTKVKEEKGKARGRERGGKQGYNESDRTKGRGLGACVPTQQYGEFREAAQYPPDRQLIDILPHTRHVTRYTHRTRESDTHVMHRADRYACDFTARCRAFLHARVHPRPKIRLCVTATLTSSSPSPFIRSHSSSWTASAIRSSEL